jgi:phenylacetic acid degradation operon negative regulatory protein
MTIVKKMTNSDHLLHPTQDLTNPLSRGKSFINDIAVVILWERERWLPTATWVALLEALDLTPAAARTALRRMSEGGFLDRETREGMRGFGMSSRWVDYLMRTLTLEQPNDRFALLTFSIPESQRAKRHAVRSILERHRFASLGYGTWIASTARLGLTRLTLETSGLAEYVDIFISDYDGFASIDELVRRCWDLDAVEELYRRYVRDATELLATSGDDPRDGFRALIFASNAYRRLSYEDPQLPARALPGDWPRTAFVQVYNELVARFADSAVRYVDSLRSG